MSNALKDALKASLESEESVVDVAERIEEIIAETEGGSVSSYIEQKQEAVAVSNQLEKIAEVAEAAAASDEEPAQAAVESVVLAMESALACYRLGNLTPSSESVSDRREYCKVLADQCRSHAATLREAAPSFEAFPFKEVFRDASNIDKQLQRLKKETARSKANSKFYAENGVAINHFGIFRFLTMNGQPVKNIAEGLKINAGSITKLFAVADQIRAYSDKQIEAFRSTNFDDEAAAKKFAEGILGGKNISHQLHSLKDLPLLHNGKVVVHEDYSDVADSGEHAKYSIIDVARETAKPDGKANWWSRAGAGIIGALAGLKVAKIVNTSLFVVVGTPTSFAGVILGAGFGLASMLYGLVKGFGKGKELANEGSTALKTVSTSSGHDIDTATTDVIHLAEKVLSIRRNMLDSYERAMMFDNEHSAKLKGANISSEVKAQVKTACYCLLGALEAEWSAYNAAVSETETTLNSFIQLVDKLNDAAEKAA